MLFRMIDSGSTWLECLEMMCGGTTSRFEKWSEFGSGKNCSFPGNHLRLSESILNWKVIKNYFYIAPGSPTQYFRDCSARLIYILVHIIFLFIVLGFLSPYVSSLLCPVCASFISVSCNQRLLCEFVLSPCLLLFLAHQLWPRVCLASLCPVYVVVWFSLFFLSSSYIFSPGSWVNLFLFL